MYGYDALTIQARDRRQALERDARLARLAVQERARPESRSDERTRAVVLAGAMAARPHTTI